MFPFTLLSIPALGYISDKKLCLNDMSASIIKKALASKKNFQIFIKGEVYVCVVENYNFKRIISVKKYSPTTKSWKKLVGKYTNRANFCTCYFMGNVYIIGGAHSGKSSASCITFNTKNLTWKIIARMNEARSAAACSVFEGRIVVTGGINDNVELNTVESYDHVSNS